MQNTWLAPAGTTQCPTHHCSLQPAQVVSLLAQLHAQLRHLQQQLVSLCGSHWLCRSRLPPRSAQYVNMALQVRMHNFVALQRLQTTASPQAHAAYATIAARVQRKVDVPKHARLQVCCRARHADRIRVEAAVISMHQFHMSGCARAGLNAWLVKTLQGWSPEAHAAAAPLCLRKPRILELDVPVANVAPFIVDDVAATAASQLNRLCMPAAVSAGSSSFKLAAQCTSPGRGRRQSSRRGCWVH